MMILPGKKKTRNYCSQIQDNQGNTIKKKDSVMMYDIADFRVSIDLSCFVGVCSQAHKLCMNMNERLSCIVLTMG